jgi:hypothetical protein
MPDQDRIAQVGDASIIFQDELGYYLLEDKPSGRTRIDVSAEEALNKIESGNIPLLECSEVFANKFLDELEELELARIDTAARSLVASGDVYVAEVSPDGENSYGLTLKGRLRSTINKLTSILTTSDQAHRDFTVAEVHEIRQCIQELESKGKQE